MIGSVTSRMHPPSRRPPTRRAERSLRLLCQCRFSYIRIHRHHLRPGEALGRTYCTHHWRSRHWAREQQILLPEVPQRACSARLHPAGMHQGRASQQTQRGRRVLRHLRTHAATLHQSVKSGDANECYVDPRLDRDHTRDEAEEP